MEPSLGGTSASPTHSFRLTVFFFSFFRHQYPELLVASYNNNEDAPHEPDGVALVWNMKYKKATPEYVFHCQVLLSPHVLTDVFLTPLPSCLHTRCEFTVLASTSTTSIHKHMFARRREKTCGAGVEWNPSTAAGLSVWGRAGYHVYLNKGPVFRRASRESSAAPPLCPALL